MKNHTAAPSQCIVPDRDHFALSAPEDALTLPLKNILVAEYGFADRRVKTAAKATTFIADDREQRDVGADKGLYSYFCALYVDVVNARAVRVRLSGNVPQAQWIDEWAHVHQIPVTRSSTSFLVTPENTAMLRSLAKAMLAIVAPGRRYDTPNYKYVCPRTADSLERLAAVLNGAWSVP